VSIIFETWLFWPLMAIIIWGAPICGSDRGRQTSGSTGRSSNGSNNAERAT